MELSEQYVLRICEKKSFSEAARSLYISQPALSATVARLEKKLGFAIFDRSKHPLSITPMGQILIEHLQEVQEGEESMLRRIENLSKGMLRAITVGGSCQSALELLPAACAHFQKQHPDISVTLDIGNTYLFSSLADKVRDGSLDLALSYEKEQGDLVAVPVRTERMVVAVSRAIPEAAQLEQLSVSREQVLFDRIPPEKELTSPAPLLALPFLDFGSRSNTAAKMAELLGPDVRIAEAHIRNSRNMVMHYRMMRLGIGAVLVAGAHVVEPEFNDTNLLYFALRSPHSHRTLYAIRRADRERPASEDFISALREANERILLQGFF